MRFASEKKERKQQLKALCGEVQVEMRSLVFFDELEQQDQLLTAPAATITDITTLVTNLLTEYKRQGCLTWHDGALPEDEIWVKLGGDHGGGSFKVMLQICNLVNANSKHNTVLIAMAECKDNPENLQQIFGPFQDQLSALQSMEWEGKHVRLFLFGDYEFLTKMFGLSGAQALHPCLFCTASRTQIQTPPVFNEGNITTRTLCQMKRDCEKIQSCGQKERKSQTI